MFKRIGVVLAAAMLATVALAAPASSQPEPRFTLQIDPTEGPVGTNIQAQVPAEATTPGGECKSPNELFAEFQTLVGQVIGEMEPGPEKLLAELTLENLMSLDPSDIDLTFFYVLVFADPATQRPAIDETTGQESETSFWNPSTGQGSITAPPAQRPKTYFVAAVCLDLNPFIDPVAATAALGAIIQGTPGLADCLAESKTPEDCVGSAVESAATALLTLAVDQNPRVAWVAPFCLLGDDGQNCAAPTAAEAAPAPAEAVAAAPRVTG